MFKFMFKLKIFLLFIFIFALSVSASASPLTSLYGAQAKLPIVMYHNFSQKSSALNPWVIRPEAFESDLLYFKQNGYTTVTMAEVIAYVYGEGTLPQKPVVLSFDDGDCSVYKYAFPLLKKYNAKAVVSILGGVTDLYSEKNRPSVLFPSMTWAQLSEMKASGLVEIQNHSYNLHGEGGAKKRGGESTDAYRERLGADLLKLQARVKQELGTTPDTFTFPYGAVSKDSNAILKDLGFKASLGCYDTVNTLTVGDTDCLYSLGRKLREHGKSSATLFDKFGE